jgi:two-component system sensor histidine kinase AlgZ
LLLAVLLLFLASPLLGSCTYRIGVLWVMAITVAASLLPYSFATFLLHSNQPISNGVRAAFVAALLTGGILFYFNWRHRVLSPALSEARLAALQSRIRPHFLFNSLNTVLSLIRPDPKRAEAVLENLADLFRALMADPRTLVPLERELALTRAYLDVESLRLGDRLKVMWHCEQAPMDASVPQLILQPLVENAIVHGIEPSTVEGEIQINIFPKDERLVMVVRNSVLADSPPSHSNRPGNHMALANIRERLDLHFDAESRMTHFTAGGEFVVQIEMPLKKISA